MQIILKPFGVAAIGTAIVALSFLAVRSYNKPTSKDAGAVVVPSATTAKTKGNLDPDTVIYDDALQNGWENYTWAKKNNFANTEMVSEGSCIQVTPGAFEALYFHHAPMSVADYDRISFRIRGDKAGAEKLKIVAQVDNTPKVTSKGKTSSKGEAAPTNKPVVDALLMLTPTPDKWKTVVVPLKQLAVEGKPNLIGFWFQEPVGNKKAPTFYVDDVRFLRPTDPAPAD